MKRYKEGTRTQHKVRNEGLQFLKKQLTKIKNIQFTLKFLVVCFKGGSNTPVLQTIK